MKNNLAIAIISIVMFGVINMTSEVMAAKVSKQELEKMEKQMEIQNQKHLQLQAQADKINKELNDVNKDMIATAQKIQNNEDKISSMEKQLSELQDELKQAENSFLSQDENLIKTLSALQNLALKPTEALFVQPLTPVETIRSAILLRESVPFLENKANQIKEQLNQIAKKKTLVEKQVAKITAQKNILEKEHENMKALVQKKSTLRNQIEIQTAEAKKKVEKLASQANDLRDLLNKLEEERKLKEKKQAEERRRLQKLAEQKKLEEQKKQAQYQSADLNKFSSNIINDIGKAFVKAKGKLPMPARGTIVATFGEEKNKGVVNKGVIIKTRNMAQVTSPFDGAVMFAGPFRGYGNMIIIEHGRGYLTLLAGLEDIDCDVGQMLLAGEPIGQMPDTSQPKLYVELRHNNQPIDPLPWYNR